MAAAIYDNLRPRKRELWFGNLEWTHYVIDDKQRSSENTKQSRTKEELFVLENLRCVYIKLNLVFVIHLYFNILLT